MALKLDVLANTRQLVSEMKNAGASVEDVSDALDDLVKDGDKAGDKLETSFRDLAKQSEAAARTIKRDLPDAYRDAARAANKFDDTASENVRNFKDEAVQNFSEVASSFDGSVQGMADGVQGLTGGLASALTPGIGIPVAVLGAAAAAFFASWQENAAKAEERINQMYDDFTESGATFVSESFIGDRIKEIQTNADQWTAALQRQEETGLDISVILRAMAGDQQAIADTHAAYVQKRDEEVQHIKDTNDEYQDQVDFIDAANTKLEAQTDWIRQVQDETDTAADKAGAYRDAMGQAADNTRTTAELLAGIKDRNIRIGISSDISAVQRDLDYIERRLRNGMSFQITPGQGRFIQ